MTDSTQPGPSSSPVAPRQVAIAVAIVAVLIGSALGGVAAVSAAEDTLTDLDADTPLTTKAAWDTFRQQGEVTVNVSSPAMQISIAKEHEDLGISGFHNDYANEYFCVEYQEDFSEKVRFYVPSNYFGPYFDKGIQSVSEQDSTTAKLVPVDNGRYTAVTIAFDGKTNACFAVDQLKGKTWNFWSRQDRRLQNVTGVSSGISGTNQWNYANEGDWSSDGTLRVPNVSHPDRVVIQYDAGVGGKEVWLKAPKRQSEQAPVYYFVRENGDGNATIVVVSEDDRPPAVRFKRQATARDGIGAMLNDWGAIDDRISKVLSGIFGGNDSN